MVVVLPPRRQHRTRLPQRRKDVAWGTTFDELRQGNGDTYHVTNCSPQVARFNRSTEGTDNWGDLENLVLADASSERLCLFAGPVLDPNDEIFVGVDAGSRTPLRVRIPKAFWKVVVAKAANGVAAYAFVLDQDLADVPLEFAVPENFRVRMIPLPELERRTGLRFPDIVRDSDQYEDRGVEVAFRGGLERVVSLAEAAIDKATPNAGDDFEAAVEAGTPSYHPRAPESLGPWRTAESLKALRTQINAAAPRRSKASDGAIGDDRHRARVSDHNAWVTDGGIGVVTAIDVTHDPAGGCDAGALAAALHASGDSRVKYIIWNRRICNREPIGGSPAWMWRPYGGMNPHKHHVHISVRPEKALYDSEAPWSIGSLR